MSLRRAVLFTIAAIVISTATSFGESITLAWDPDPSHNVAGYRLYYGTHSGVYPQVAELGLNTAVFVGSLRPGNTYYFVVTAYDFQARESSASNEVSFSTAEITIAGSVPVSPSEVISDGATPIGTVSDVASAPADPAPSPAPSATPSNSTLIRTDERRRRNEPVDF